MPRITAVFLVILFSLSFAREARADLPSAAYVAGFVAHAQNYSLSCEARSAVDWMAFWGVYVTESDFLSGLPRSDNPDTGFVGNPNDGWGNIPPYSYGVHADPIAVLIRAYGLQAEARHGASWEDLKYEIAAGRPVIVWIIGQMWGAKTFQYTASDGQTTTVASFEHTMVLTGYNASTVTLADAFSGQFLTFYTSAFLNSWGVLGNMAVFGQNSNLPSSPPDASEEGGSYTVQRGDYLTRLAAQFGTTWEELARMNDLAYPYTIYPGQVLKIPGQPAEYPPPESSPAEPSPAEPAPTEAAPAPPPEVQYRYSILFPLVEYNPPPIIIWATPPDDLFYILGSRYGSNFFKISFENYLLLPPELTPVLPLYGP